MIFEQIANGGCQSYKVPNLRCCSPLQDTDD